MLRDFFTCSSNNTHSFAVGNVEGFKLCKSERCGYCHLKRSMLKLENNIQPVVDLIYVAETFSIVIKK